MLIQKKLDGNQGMSHMYYYVHNTLTQQIELLKDSLGRVCTGSDVYNNNNSTVDSPVFLGGNKLARATSTRIRMSMRLSNVTLQTQKSQERRSSV